MGYYFYFPPENQIVVSRYVEFLEKNLISQEASGRAIEVEEIQDEDTSPSENTSQIPAEVEEVEEHNLGDLNEHANYKVDWKSSKQSTTAMFATEAAYITPSEAAMEVVWIRKFISWLGIVPKINEPIKMSCDNSTALLIVNEPRV
nr:retrovirus-related Pol polyprotein from transposon TNT 1-94 [Tanacetum cinerariifolium]